MTGPLPPLLLRGDCLAELARIPDNSVDAVVTDPPYGLGFMGHDWDDARSSPPGFERRGGKPEPNKRRGAQDAALEAGRYDLSPVAMHGFQVWVEQWAAECLRILKPGGHLLAFGGSRTWHRLAAGIEDAGFEVRDSLAWLYGSGMPKSLDVSKAIDKLDAAAVRLERAREFQAWLRQYLTPKQVNEATGTDMGHHLTTHPTQPAVATATIFDMLRPLLPEVPEGIELLVAERTVESENYARRGSTGVHEKVAGVSEWRAKYEGGKVAPVAEKKDVAHTPEAEAWQGWGTALKPAFEPIVVARKPLPYRRTVAANVLDHGTGALNIDATRLGGDGGRWPTNAILDEESAAWLDETAGARGAAAPASGPTRSGRSTSDSRGAFNGTDEAPAFHDDKGGASRFFYVAKAPKSERPVYWRPSCNCETIKPCAELSPQRATDESRSTDGKSWSTSTSGKKRKGGKSHRATTSTTETATSSTTSGGTFNSSRNSSTSESIQAAKSGAANGGSPAESAASSSPSPSSTGTSLPKGGPSTVAADPAILSEWSETSVCANCGAPSRRESHATVKPLAIMRRLCRLVTPPGGVVVDPFAGSGTTLEAAYLEGFEAIGCEMTPEYWPLVAARIERVTR